MWAYCSEGMHGKIIHMYYHTIDTAIQILKPLSKKPFNKMKPLACDAHPFGG